MEPTNGNSYHTSNSYQNYRPPRRIKILEKLRSGNPALNRNLFIATCITTFLTGWLQNGYWQAGLWYGGGIIAILLAHEMGHYLMCRKYGIKATLPFFIPFFPVGNPFGTLGAVIRMESPIPNRKALFDVAVAGPLAGLVITIPAIYFGVQLSEIVDAQSIVGNPGVITLGESFIFAQISNLAIGTLPETQDFMIHPLAYAGWAGLLITALNLLPIGQLDGGHIVYSILGKNHRFVAIMALIAFAYIAVFMFAGWIVLLALLVWVGPKHPPTLDESAIDWKRSALGILTIVILFFSFTPKPFMPSIGLLEAFVKFLNFLRNLI